MTAETPATASTPAEQAKSERRWHRNRAMIITGLAAVVLIVGIGFFKDPIVYYGQQAKTWSESFRSQQTAPIAKAATTTSVVTTDDGRTKLRKITVQDLDIESLVETAQKQAAAAQAEAATLKQQLATAAANTTAAVQEATKNLTDKFEQKFASLSEDLKKATTATTASAPASSSAPKVVQQGFTRDDDQPAPRQQVAQSRGGGRIVTPDNASSEDTALMAQVYRQNGRVPGGEKLSGFSRLERGESFRCPDGSAGELVTQGNLNGGISARWRCRRH